MSDIDSNQQELAHLEQISQRGFVGKLAGYGKLSGPGWIQAAVTLGGGSLVGALYLGVIGGYQFMWLQPLAMLCGIIMLAAISHVTLSSKERPFVSVKKNISPTLAWGWLIATVIADVVFCAAQFSLGTDAAQGNLGILPKSPFVITGIFAVLSLSLLWLSRQDGKASGVIDKVLKTLVAIVVLAFMGVVAKLALSGQVTWGALFAGLIPDFTALFKPASTYAEAISATGESSDFWTEFITSTQRDKIIAAFGSAVGINMTFLLPYSIRAKGWGRNHRELSRYDLVLGLFVPFILATSFLVITTSAQFHAKKESTAYSVGAYHKIVDKRLATLHEGFAAMDADKKAALRESLPQAEKDMGVILAERTAVNLAQSLEPFLGKNAQLIFGIGVLAMALSTMIVHMMMNGYAISEAFGKPGQKGIFMIGALMPALTGFLSPILWKGDPDVKTAMVIPAAVIATVLLPIAYLIFILLMNSKKTLGEDMPQKRIPVNILMILAGGIATFASVWKLVGMNGSSNPYIYNLSLVGLIGLPVLFILGVLGFLKREKS